MAMGYGCSITQNGDHTGRYIRERNAHSAPPGYRQKHQQRRPVSVPMSEWNLRQHDHLTSSDRGRSVEFTDCCTYCDRYHDGSLTETKQIEIDTWRKNVNKNMHADEFRRYRASKKNKSKFKYLAYEPDGIPDNEPGFRRVPIPKDLRHKPPKPIYGIDKNHDWTAAKTEIDSLSNDISQLSVDHIHTTLDLKSEQYSNPTKERPRVQFSGASFSENRKRYKHKPKAKSLSQETLVQSDADTELSTSGTDYSRSNSNRLLNCLTIDDYKIRYGGSYSKISSLTLSQPSEPSRDEVSTKSTTGKASRKRETSESQQSMEGDYERDLHPGMNGPTPSLDKQSATVRAAFDVMFKPEHKLHNNAYKNYYQTAARVDAQSASKKRVSKESKRFQRLHRALHEWMEEELLQPRQPQMRRLAQRQRLTDIPRGGSSTVTLGPSHPHSAPTPYTQYSPQYNGQAGVYYPPPYNRQMRQGYNHYMDQNGIREYPDDPAFASRNDNFLEMLMEMDDQDDVDSMTVGPSKETTIVE